MKNPLYNVFQEIKMYIEKHEELNIDTYKIAEPVSIDVIDEWEEKNNVKLPEGYRNLLLLANGLNAKWCGEISSLEQIKMLNVPGYEGYYRIGSFTGGTFLIDKNGTVYENDEDFGREEISFEKILNDYIIYYLKDQLRENGFSVE